MSAEADQIDRDAQTSLQAARKALRLAFGVTGCFVFVQALGWEASFLAPLLTAQLLIKLEAPPSTQQGLGLIVLIVGSTGAVMVLTAPLIHYPAVLVLALALLNYLAFYGHRSGAPEIATLLLQISAATLPVFAVLSPGSAASFAVMLVSAGIVALAATWIAYAAFPVPKAAILHPSAATSEPRATDGHGDPSRHALLDVVVLFPVLAWLILDASEVAIVVLIIILTLLRLRDAEHGPRAAFGLILANLIGGLAAVLVYNLAILGDTLAFFCAILLATSLAFATRIVRLDRRAPIYAVSYTTFILLVGLGLTPLPGGSGEAFLSRILNVLLATAYAIGMMSLVERWRPQAGGRLS